VNRYLRRIETAIRLMDVGISNITIANDFLKAVNTALRSIGSPIIKDLGNKGQVVRAMNVLEAAAD